MSLFKNKKKTSVHSAVNYQGKLLCADTPFAVTESFKTLRTNLMYTSGGEKCPVYGVTSCFQSSGKSLISANLAIAFSMMEKKVLLIDSDMRKPVQHRCFSLQNEKGLSEWLSGMSSFEEVVQHLPGYPGLDVITAGHIPPNPQELLAGHTAQTVIGALKQYYDVIVLDLPPAGVVSDAVTVSSIVTGYLFVVRSGEDDAESLKRVVDSMQHMNCRILGTVLNGIDLKNGEYSKNHGRYSYYRRDQENGD